MFWLFAKRTPAEAVTAAILGGYLLLPRNYSIEMPAVPSLNKDSIPAIAAVLAASMMLSRDRLRQLAPGSVQPGWFPRSRAVQLLLILMGLAAVLTVLTNGDRLVYGGWRALPALRPYDIASTLGNTLFAVLPFLLARRYLAHPEGQRTLVIGMVVAGIAYSFLALYEVRMSPQLSRMIYGYFPHDWRQHLRGGGYRPVVFLHHGLWLAIFFCGSFLAALSLWRSSTDKMRTRWLIAAIWMLMVLVLSKGIGALGIGLLLGAVIAFLPIRLQIICAAGLAVTILTYPMLRGASLAPTEFALSIAEDVDPDRAASLRFRLDNEDILLDHANRRPLFGWGGWGRNRVIDDRGRDISVTDGYWIISIGINGWLGYLAQFGLLLIPMIFMGLRWKALGLTSATAGIAMALTANMIDLIPNATLTPVTWLLAGALAGRLELGRVDRDASVQAVSDLPLRRNAYTRQTRRHGGHAPPQGATPEGTAT
ncbi:hypothetical protein Q4511_13635 [Paracoccus sp. 1_MG-2023]|uniref:hypothetical protein n=1 Tax=Paracoccus sp. 1_MG-2023 TaxID=3062651 RepID=UPI0026E329FD|nr:hypothetical protein [Paracoccus sp. 1_MG-2023]MDO6669969.1 hypothetical protein [Paracoccus sp. 1_MG-2023]